MERFAHPNRALCISDIDGLLEIESPYRDLTSSEALVALRDRERSRAGPQTHREGLDTGCAGRWQGQMRRPCFDPELGHLHDRRWRRLHLQRRAHGGLLPNQKDEPGDEQAHYCACADNPGHGQKQQR